MFSASSANTPAGTVRTSRRRARPASNEGSIPKAKRQRSTMTEQTFVPPDGPVEMEETKPNKLLPALARRESPPANILPPKDTKDIAVRGKKQRSGERLAKEDGSVNLVSFHAELELLILFSHHALTDFYSSRPKMIHILSASFLLCLIDCAEMQPVCHKLCAKSNRS